MARGQQGIALIGLLALLTLGASYWLVSALANPANRTASDRAHNAKVMAEAKSALLGWVATTAAGAAEPNPGRLPCPETPASQNDQTAGAYDASNDGVAAANCALPAVGRLPWRTLGLDKLFDAAGEPLWYVVSPAWAFTGANTVINSNTAGQLTLDAAGDIVALIIAPGRAINIQAGGGCVARNQTRVRTPNVAWDARDFLDCTNSDGDAVFTAGPPTASFNDQVLAVTAGDALPVIEAAVADRFARNVAPLLRSVYSNSDGTNANWPAAPRLPFAAAFPSPLTYKGVAARTQGMLPFTYGTDGAGGACNPADSRCDSTFVAWRTVPAPTITGPNMVAGSDTCNATTTTITCSFRGNYFIWLPASTTFTVTHTASNVGLSLRQFDTTVAMGGVDPAGRSASGITLNADGSAQVSVSGTTTVAGGGGLIGALLEGLLCGLGGILGAIMNCANYTVTIPVAVLDDHPLILDVAANPQQWFVRNRWHEVAYYAVAPTMVPGAAGGCTSNVNCLRVTYHASDFRQRGVLAFAGRSLNGQPRPPTAAADLLEGTNNNGDTTFALRAPPLVINRQFNDRIGVIDLSP